jgi:hypothetical protein
MSCPMIKNIFVLKGEKTIDRDTCKSFGFGEGCIHYKNQRCTHE